MGEYDKELAGAETYLRESDIALSVGWGLGFLVDNWEILKKALWNIGEPDLGNEIERLADDLINELEIVRDPDAMFCFECGLRRDDLNDDDICPDCEEEE